MLDPRQERIKRLFQSAAERPRSERDAYLDGECGGDAALRSAIESLLAAGEESGAFLEGSPVLSGDGCGPDPPDTSATTHAHTASPAPARVIDRYRLLERIGAGGMGEVWLAEQQEPVRRQVALKLIKAGMDTEQVIARFEAERQALALMDHPAIARVLDAGATPAGRPYFVMEHVPGRPMTQHCDHERLGIVARLDLFVQVCEGVQHAHQKAILHRDLKPSNILVTTHDGRATPRIIDFGVAKAMARPLTAHTLHTGLGVLIGTPGYMSPEQADLGRHDVDTRTDVYSLGVVLYELLVGVLPFEQEKLRQAGWEGLGRLLRDEEPVTPSRRLITLPAGVSSESARLRQQDLPTLRRQLSGDLDWITRKAIDPDRERRYRSPSDLADDIRRHLRDEPVLAGSPGAAYRTGKFVRRHRIAVAGAGAVVLAVTLGLIGTTFGLVRARKAEREAREQAAASERVSDFFANVLASVDAARMGRSMVGDLRERAGADRRARGGSEAEVAATLASFDEAVQGVNAVDAARSLIDEEILTRASRTIDEETGGDELLGARLQATLGSVYQKLTLHAEAGKFFDKAFRTRERLLGKDHPSTLRSRSALGVTNHMLGRHAEAEAVLKDVAGDQRRVLGAEHPDTLRTTSHLASALQALKRVQEAEVLFRDTLAIHRRVHGDGHAQTAASMRRLADVLPKPERNEEAEALYLEALDAQRRATGPEAGETLLIKNNLASLYVRAGQYQKAETLYLEVLDTRRRSYGEEHLYTIAIKDNLARLYLRTNRQAEAERLFGEVLAVPRRAFPSEHPWRQSATLDQAAIYLSQERYAEAEPLYSEVLETKRRTLGEIDGRTLSVFATLIEVHRKLGQGERVARESLSLLAARKRAAERCGADAVSKNNYAWSLLTFEPADERDPKRALKLALEAASETEFKNPGVLDTLAFAYHMTGSHSDAARTQQQAIALLPEGASPTREQYEERLVKFRAALPRP